jgi:glycosyltransferase involved in cell wall biosynthesis
MNYLFIAPRFHTNLYHQVIALQNAGNVVMVAIVYKGKSEHYENIRLNLIPLSIFSKCITGLLHLFRKGYLKSDFELRMQSPGRELRKVFRNFKPDVVVLKAYQNMLALKALRLSKAFGSKVLMHTQTVKTDIFGSSFLFKMNIRLFKKLKVFAYITPVLSNYEKFKSFGIENVFYIPFVFPIAPDMKPRTLSENEPFRILSIGKYTRRKDQLTLIKAVEQMHSEGFKLELSVYGEMADPVYFKELTRHIKTNASESYIRLYENIGYDKILNEYSRHHLYVLPAYNEPAAFSIVEALAYALPIICSDACGTSPYIEPGINGYVFKAKDPKDLIEKIKQTFINKEHYGRLSKGAMDSALKHHNCETFVLKISNVINQDKH